ncbi:hypothetical protein O3M35_009662 [Rhynocoris fuscipes]|uniref:Uncharacterized protein n=1 Tax=Rhynocoris fuscipes TaxID=488301 RepID=A0AAW1D4J7_9HEMI
MIDQISAKNRQQRSIGILSGFLGTTTPSPLSKHPVWKVHRYSGIELRPVHHPDEHHHYHDDTDVTEYDEHESRVSEEEEEAPSLIEIPEDEAKSYLTGDHHEGAYKSAETQKILEELGLARSDQEAEDKIGVVGHLIKKGPLKKKKKKVIKLIALAKLLKKIKEGKIAIAKGEIALEDVVGEVINKVTLPEAVYPIKSAVYRKIPLIYPKAPSILSKLPIIGSRFAPSGTPINVPEPVLPEIPALSLVPEAPKLPNLYLSGPYKVPYSSGSYVSIKVPKPSQGHDHVAETYGPPSHIDTPPSTSYGVPFEKPIKVYGSEPQPRDPVYTQYGAPVQQYFSPSVPEYQPSQQYSQPAPEYQSAPPQNSPSQQQYTQSSTDYQTSQQYTAPAQDYQQPSPQYSPPVQQYGPPASEYQQAAPQYSAPVPEQIQSPQYNTAAYQQTQYTYPPAAQKKSFKEGDSEISSSSWQPKKESISDSNENEEAKET